MTMVVEAVCSGESSESNKSINNDTNRTVEISLDPIEDDDSHSDSASLHDPAHRSQPPTALRDPTTSSRQHFSDGNNTNKLSGTLMPIPKHTNESKCSSTTSSYHSIDFGDCNDLEEEDLHGSEGSFCLDDLVGSKDAQNAGTADQGVSGCESSMESGMEAGGNANCDNDSCNDASQTERSSITSGQGRRRRDNGQGWENLSSRTLYGEEESSFDMSSRSVLEDFDFEIDCADIIEEGAHLPPRGSVKFTAGRTSIRSDSLGVRATRAGNSLAMSPMTRITEHTKESSAWGSQSDLSGRCSFESASPSLRFGSIRTRSSDVVKASPSPNPSHSSLRVRRTSIDFDDLAKRLSGSKLE